MITETGATLNKNKPRRSGANKNLLTVVLWFFDRIVGILWFYLGWICTLGFI
jgi:hypothetical protein